MMKKFLLSLAVLALCAQGIDAKTVTVDQAMRVAKQYTAANQKMFKSSNAPMRLNHVARSMKGINDYYVFNLGTDEGFVIVAGDDELSAPVLGYSNKGSFDVNTVPETMRMMLVEYQNQMDWLRQHPELAGNHKLNYDLQPYGVYPILGDVHWWQGSPYNGMAPAAANMPADCLGRSYVGCAATALAQIMKGLRHPAYGYGQHTYTYTYAGQEYTLSSDFSSHSYKYSNMRTGYGPTSTQTGYRDVAQLFYDVDVALNMRFMGENGSDAYTRDIIKAMIAYFDYNPGIQYLLKSNYTYNQEAWTDMIYTELDNGRPVYYLGYRTIDNSGNPCNVGHAFVLDGYDRDGKVHVNWGFQPEEYNTYFELDMLSPRMYTAEGYGEYDVEKSGFNANQSMIIGICPDTTDLGGVVVKQVNLVADVMPANDIRASIDVEALSGSWSGNLRYGIVSKSSDGTYSPVYSTWANNLEIEENGVVNLNLSGAYPYYLYEGRTYYIVVWSPYFNNSYDWNWFLDEPVPFTVGDWVTPPVMKGDVNGDGFVTISDVTALIAMLLNGNPTVEDNPAADMNGDGSITIADVTAINAYLLNGGSPE